MLGGCPQYSASHIGDVELIARGMLALAVAGLEANAISTGESCAEQGEEPASALSST